MTVTKFTIDWHIESGILFFMKWERRKSLYSKVWRSKMHRFLNLLLNIITFSLQGKHHLQQIEIIRHERDSINGFNCTKIKGAQVNASGTCVCKNRNTILSDESGGLECYENIEDKFQSKIINFSPLIHGVCECIVSNHRI